MTFPLSTPDDATAWAARSGELASHALETLVTDRHNWYAVRRLTERHAGRLVSERNGTLTPATLARHFEGRELHHLLVVSGYAVIPSYHAVGGFGWIGFVLNPPSGLEPGDPPVSWHHAERLANALRDLGLSTLVEHADGLGTYQVWLAVDHGQYRYWDELKGIPLARFAERLVSDLAIDAEVTPWLPLPGRHHSEDWWSQVWSGTTWLRGAEAVSAVLSLRANPMGAVRAACE